MGAKAGKEGIEKESIGRASRRPEHGLGYLVQVHALSGLEAKRLMEAGAGTVPALAEKTREPGHRVALAEQAGMAQDRLLLAAAAANRDERECTRCFYLAEQEQVNCSQCGAELGGPKPTPG